jgi:hypothetical protein
MLIPAFDRLRARSSLVTGVRRSPIGPGFWPGPRRQARWAGRGLQGQQRATGASRAPECEAPLEGPTRPTRGIRPLHRDSFMAPWREGDGLVYCWAGAVPERCCGPQAASHRRAGPVVDLKRYTVPTVMQNGGHHGRPRTAPHQQPDLQIQGHKHRPVTTIARSGRRGRTHSPSAVRRTSTSPASDSACSAR